MSKLFTTFVGLGGIAFLGSFIANVGSALIEAKRMRWKKPSVESTNLMTLFQDMNKIVDHFKVNLTLAEQKKHIQTAAEKEKNALIKAKEAVMRWTHVAQKCFWCLIVVSGAFCLNWLNGRKWSGLETIYFAFVTASTIGFGDLLAQIREAKMFACFYVSTAVMCAGEIFCQKRQWQGFKQELSKSLDIKHLTAMDADSWAFFFRSVLFSSFVALRKFFTTVLAEVSHFMSQALLLKDILEQNQP